MSTDLADIPEADATIGAPHPRFARDLIGREAQEAAFLEAFNSNKLHHAWLITGPRGIGKSTLTWKIARFLLSHPPRGSSLPGIAAVPDSLETDRASPVARRIDALSEQGLFLLRRPWDQKTKKLKSVITVDEVRGLKRFFNLSQAEGGWRVVIVDCADEMNSNAANALLKLLEEPPAHTVFLLISHLPSRLLPTVRSRCRTLPCPALSEGQVEQVLAQIDDTLDPGTAGTLAGLSGGSVGVAIWLHQLDGPALMQDVQGLFASMPGVDRMRALALATSMVAREASDRRELFLQLTDTVLADLARMGVLGDLPGASGPIYLRKLSPTPQAGRKWAEARQDLTARVRRGLAVNLDPHSLILDMVLRIDALAGQCAAS